MKRLFFAVLSLIASTAFGTTLNPIQLLNPVGSTSGQAIISTGASSAPAWGGVGVNGIAAIAANTVLANVTGASASPTAAAIQSCSTTTSALQYTSGTGFSCGTGFAALTGASFTGASGLAYSAATFFLNDTSGTNQSAINFDSNGTVRWQMFGQSNSGALWGVSRFVGGAFTDIPLQISNSTGVVTMVDGITSTPISGSTGSFTTLAASGLISPTSTVGIKGTTTNDSPASGSIGEVVSQTVPVGSAVSLTTATATNVASISLTAGQWDVCGTVWFNPGATTTTTVTIAWTSIASATLPTTPNNGGEGAGTFSINGAQGSYSMTAGCQVIKLSSTTTVYLEAYSAFATSTNAAYGFISAERRR